MRRKLVLIALLLFTIAGYSFGQNRLQVAVKDSITKEALIGAVVQVNAQPMLAAAVAASGIAEITSLPDGSQTLAVSLVGYQTKVVSVSLPFSNPAQIVTVYLSTDTQSLDEVTVTSTRTNSRLEDLPVKVEVLGLEEMNEEASIVPGNVASILGDISVIHIQKTSPVNGNQGIRMQGLDPKYTQILRDGLPLYEGFSGNLGVLQIPPLDLKQVEIFKGSVSTLYGGGAIGGMINLISKAPTSEPELTVILNRSSLKETNLNAYYAQKFGQAGLTLFAGATDQQAVDVNGDDFSDSPLIRQLTVHPRFFYTFNETSKGNLGYSFVSERREGGDVHAIKEPTALHSYFSRNDYTRHSLDYTLQHAFQANHQLTFKGTGSFFDRTANDTNYVFRGKQMSLYSELSDVLTLGKHTMVFGGNITLEQFRKGISDINQLVDFTYRTIGLFVQDDWVLSKKVTAQAGLRYDAHNQFGDFLLPRLSLLFKPTAALTVRTSVGTGYKTPNVFSLITPATIQTKTAFRYLLPVDANTQAERSLGTNMDIAYQTTIGENLMVQLDQAFYYTHIRQPIVAQATPAGFTQLFNAGFGVNSLGTDTYLRFTYKEIEAYFGYNHTISRREGSGEKTYLPFAPQDKFSTTLAYSIPEKWRMGIEASWVGNQYLYDNTLVNNYWFFAAMVSRQFKHMSIILNCENLFDIKQSSYEQVVTGTLQRPSFRPIWAPQEGRIVNLALKYNL